MRGWGSQRAPERHQAWSLQAQEQDFQRLPRNVFCRCVHPILIGNAYLSGQLSPAPDGESEWQATNGTPQAPASAQPPPPIQAIPHYPPPPEGFYPYFYPPPPGFIPPGHEGQSEGNANGASHPPAMVPYYPLAPPGFFPHFAAPVGAGAFPPPPNGTAVTTIEPTEASRNVGQSAEATGQTNGTVISGKKRSRAGKGGETKTKKQKAGVTAKASPTSGGTVAGSDHASEPGAISPEHDD